MRSLMDAHKKLIGRVGAVLACLVIAISSLAIVGVAFADDDDGSDEYSFYSVASAISAYYDNIHTKGEITSDYNGHDVNIQNAGDFVGFLDPDYNKGLLFGGVTSYLASNAQSHGYESYTDNNGIYQYMVYGHALGQLGFDATGNEAIDPGAIVRVIFGGIFLVFYLAATSVDFVFHAILVVLQFFNPFAWVNQAIEGAPEFMQGQGLLGGDATGIDTNPAFDTLRNYVSRIFGFLKDLGTAITVMLFVGGVAAALIFWRRSNSIGNTVRKFFIRTAVIFFGVPFLGAMYTSVLNVVADTYGGSDAPAANQIVASTFLDFENWARNTNLALPYGDGDNGGVTISVDTSSSSSGVASVSPGIRGAAVSINRLSGNGLLADSASASKTGDTVSFDTSNTASTGEHVSAGIDLIGRYMSNAYYHSSDSETEYRSRWFGDADKAKNLFDFIENAKNADTYDTTDFVNFDRSDSNGNLLTVGDTRGANQGNGALALASGSGVSKGETIKFSGNARPGELTMGLSPLALSNYLNTSFDDASVVTYSTVKMTSQMSKVSHHSVNVVGNGFVKALYYGNGITMLVAITVIGFAYAIGMLINSISRGIRLILKIPGALLGSFKAIASFVAYVFMMSIEILGTALLYSVVIQVLIALNDVLETGLSYASANANLNGTILLGSGTFGAINLPALLTPIAMIVSIIINIFFTIAMLRLRPAAVKAMNEMVTGIINRIFDPSPRGGGSGAGGRIGNAGGPGSLGRAASAGIAGAAMGAGSGALAGGVPEPAGISSMIQGVAAGDGAGGVSEGGVGGGAGGVAEGASMAQSAGGTSAGVRERGGIEDDAHQRLPIADDGAAGQAGVEGVGGPADGGAAEGEDGSTRDVRGTESPETLSAKGADAGAADANGAEADAGSTKDVKASDEKASGAKSAEAASAAGKAGDAKAGAGKTGAGKAGAKTGVKGVKPSDEKAKGAKAGAKGTGKAGSKAGIKGVKASDTKAKGAQGTGKAGAKSGVKGVAAMAGQKASAGAHSVGGVGKGVAKTMGRAALASVATSTDAGSGSTTAAGSVMGAAALNASRLEHKDAAYSKAMARVRNGEAVKVGGKTYTNQADLRRDMRANQQKMLKAREMAGQITNEQHDRQLNTMNTADAAQVAQQSAVLSHNSSVVSHDAARVSAEGARVAGHAAVDAHVSADASIHASRVARHATKKL